MDGQLRSIGHRAVVATLLLVAAGCTSGFGPLNAPDESQARVVAAAAGWLASSDRLTPGPVFVLDKTDPQAVEAMRVAIGDSGAMLADGEGDVAVTLDEASRHAIQDRFKPARSVTFVAHVADIPPGPTRVVTIHTCPSFQDGGSYIALTPARARSVHGGNFLVVVEYSDGCGVSHFALWTIWEAGSPVGGEWKVSNVIEGGGVTP